jgi:hypothetical protein
MAEKAGGAVPLYGCVISDALKDPKTTLDALTDLRDRGRKELEETGDLAGALKRLEAEIVHRQA